MSKGGGRKQARKQQKHQQRRTNASSKHEDSNPKADEAQKPVCPQGLQNLGNTCYLNSTLQALASVPQVQKRYLSNEKSIQGNAALGFRDFIVASFADGGEHVKKKHKGVHNPQRVLAAVSGRYPQFKGRQQQDAQELLTALLDMLMDQPTREHTTSSSDGDDDNDRHGDPDISASLFRGHLCSTVICGVCGKLSTTTEPFTSLSLAVPSGDSVDQHDGHDDDEHGVRGKSAAGVSQGHKTGNKAAKQQSSQKNKKAIKQARKAKQQRGMGGMGDDEDGRLLGGTTAHPPTTTISSTGVDTPDNNAPDAPSPHHQQQHSRVTVASCMSAFFNPEPVQRGCDCSPMGGPVEPQPAGAAQAAEGVDGVEQEGVQDGAPPGGGVAGQGGGRGGGLRQPVSALRSKSNKNTRGAPVRRVSFAETQNSIKLIPGSAEQRGTDFRAAMRGHMPFRRPLAHQGASLLLTADVGSIMRDRMFLRLQPYDDDEVTQSVLARSLRVATVRMDPIAASDDDDEQMDVTSRAQVLIDCMADMVEHHGIEGLRAMTASGMHLARSNHECGWMVHGPGDIHFGGDWEYPHEPPPRRDSVESPRPPVMESLLTCELGRASSFGSFGSMGPLQEALREEEAAAAAGACSSLDVMVGMHECIMGGGPLGAPSSEGRLLGGAGGEEGPLVGPLVQEGPGTHEPVGLCLCKGWVDAEAGSDGGLGQHGVAMPPRGGPKVAGGEVSGVVENGVYENGGSDMHDTATVHAAAAAAGGGMLAAVVDVAVEEGRLEVPVVTTQSSSNTAVVLAQGEGGNDDVVQQEEEGVRNEEEGVQQEEEGVRNEVEEIVVADVEDQQHQVDSTSSAPAKPIHLVAATRQYTLQQLPEVLCVHLKRFMSVVSNKGVASLHKIDGCIAFDTDIDVGAYCCDAAIKNSSTCFELVGVVSHSGTLKSGHYVAYVKRTAAMGTSTSHEDEDVGDDGDAADAMNAADVKDAKDAGSPKDTPKDDAPSDTHPTIDMQDSSTHDDGVQNSIAATPTTKDTPEDDDDMPHGVPASDTPPTQPHTVSQKITTKPDPNCLEDDTLRSHQCEGSSVDGSSTDSLVAALADDVTIKATLTPRPQDVTPIEQWYYVSDAHVKAVSLDKVLACEAYVLLYARRHDL